MFSPSTSFQLQPSGYPHALPIDAMDGGMSYPAFPQYPLSLSSPPFNSTHRVDETGKGSKRKAANQAIDKISNLHKKEVAAQEDEVEEEEWYSSEDDDPDDLDIENPTVGSQGYAVDDGFVEKEDIDHRNDDDWLPPSDVEDDEDDDGEDEIEFLRKKIADLEKENKRLRRGRDHWRETYLKFQQKSTT